MNKLVSKNPVQRFKQGRKIEKFQGGGEPQKKYYLTNNGGLVYETPETVDALYSDAVAANLTNPYNVKTNSGYKFQIGSFDGGKTYYRLDTRKKLDNNSANFLIRKAIKPKKEEVGKVGDGRDTKGVSNGVGTRKDWKAEYTNNFLNTLSNDEITHLKQAMGSDNGYLDPSKMQEFLIANLGKGSLGNYGKEGVDGRWGNVSRDAWELYKKKYISTPKQEEIFETPAENNETPITTPVVTPTKYTTNNTYMDKTQFRDNIGGLGIQSNADLINWMYQTGAEGYNFGGNQWAKQFRSDVDRALGGDYSDANIRKTFNTAGNWGRGFLGGGDLSDFQNAMATNAGVWNGIADAGKQPAIQFDRSATREWLRNNAGGSAYAFTGDQRKAVRNILNGQGTDQDKELVKGNAVLAKALTGYFKTGGNMLPSRNIVERFKQRNFR